MADPFVAEIRIFPFNFAPRGWAFCDGQLLPIPQNTALFSLLGTTYGGNGATTFALPDIQGRAVLQHGQGPGLSDRMLGESAGEPNVTLLESEIPNHSHGLRASGEDNDASSPAGAHWGGLSRVYAAPTGLEPMDPNAITPAGGDQPHNNMMPYLTLNFCIALQGVFPPRS